MSPRIAQVSRSDTTGGAERIALNLHTAYRDAGVDATLHVGKQSSQTQGVAVLNPSSIADEADVLHLHNLHGGYFDVRLLKTLSQRLPIVVTLHDEWLYTAGPTYAMRPPNAIQRWRRSKRRRLLRRCRLHLVSPSDWLMQRALHSIPEGTIASRHVIPNGVCTQTFAPPSEVLRRSARNQLGLAPDTPAALFAAHNASQHPFKDLPTILDATRQLQHKACLLVAGTTGKTLTVGTTTIRYLGPIDDMAMLTAYHAADVYLHAANADNFPNVVLEAMACGLPVIATRVGGIPEQVVDQTTGHLVDQGEAAAIAHHANALFAAPATGQRMGHAGAKRVASHFTLARQAEAYRTLYAEIARGHNA